ncbi:hypothetical protein RS022_00790 [Candidatus Phytoplasma rubi]|uniref:Uncharacterized protein n=1 Tax=Candidatus Phytoplasma rubi TaxID=399025 RepID=A0ABY7BQP2_9MOLU|nr:hypothetical protein [Candidatus Phytoplasma rubi]WAN63090.1 hypothetical protein RS022_00790 [Candidatus Phytoplasma rubi]
MNLLNFQIFCLIFVFIINLIFPLIRFLIEKQRNKNRIKKVNLKKRLIINYIFSIIFMFFCFYIILLFPHKIINTANKIDSQINNFIISERYFKTNFHPQNLINQKELQKINKSNQYFSGVSDFMK